MKNQGPVKERGMKKLDKPLSWEPARRGVIYCSPACGNGCLHADFKLATGRANALAAKMGAGWKPNVWENCGWHYSVKKGIAEMHGEKPTVGKPYYLLFINATGNQLFVGQGGNATALLEAGMREAQRKLALWSRELESVRK